MTIAQHIARQRNIMPIGMLKRGVIFKDEYGHKFIITRSAFGRDGAEFTPINGTEKMIAQDKNWKVEVVPC